jgi:flagellar biosynthesis protein FliR
MAFLKELKPFVWGTQIFQLGLWIAMPLVAMLLFVNLVMGVIARVAPQVNIFGIGFPMTLGVGLIGLVFTMPLMQGPFAMTLEMLLKLFQ